MDINIQKKHIIKEKKKTTHYSKYADLNRKFCANEWLFIISNVVIISCVSFFKRNLHIVRYNCVSMWITFLAGVWALAFNLHILKEFIL